MALAFALDGAGFKDGTLDTKAAVTLEKEGDGFTVTRSALTLHASVPGIEQAQFDEIAQGAKANCPISKLLKAEVTLDATLASRCTAVHSRLAKAITRPSCRTTATGSRCR